ncbi:hypothetical protein RFI_39656 [Reticulomyxa filosa]|uniref:Uncharacterized protein n=1 Tax=Reticulomyxa filosa TaxID=46433 RepID=X6L9U1_RETFI|nr:hypothetical protein RFI_39656 [Reticulomyxa filosa]|eukprot:ETN97871.1 hypothetical protein RFI_39656 [Reticulomyxa filosa]
MLQCKSGRIGSELRLPQRSPVSSTFKVSGKVKLTREKIGDEVISLDWSMDTVAMKEKNKNIKDCDCIELDHSCKCSEIDCRADFNRSKEFGTELDDWWVDDMIEDHKKKRVNLHCFIIVVCISVPCAKSREYFASHILANVIVNDLKEDPVRKEISRRKKRISRLRKYLQGIGNYEKRLVNKE